MLFSAIYFLILVVDAFIRENAYQLLALIALGILNIVQIAVYGAEAAPKEGGGTLVVICIAAILQTAIVALTPRAYAGFGWRMFSKMAADARLRSAEERRRNAQKLDWFSALVKLDIQLLTSCFIVAGINGINPGGKSIADLISVAASAFVCLGAWLGLCHRAVMMERSSLALVSDATFPAAHLFTAVIVVLAISNRSKLTQAHGFVYIVLYSVLFIICHSAVWFDARMLSKKFGTLMVNNRRTNSGNNLKNMLSPGQDHHHHHHHNNNNNTNAHGNGGKSGDTHHHHNNNHGLPEELEPLLKGAWLKKRSAITGGGGYLSAVAASAAVASPRGLWNRVPSTPSSSSLMPSAVYNNDNKGASSTCMGWLIGTKMKNRSADNTDNNNNGTGGIRNRKKRQAGSSHWRFFQLSHDGSTLRWDWEKYILLLHVDGITCRDDNLTITLSLTLDPDLILEFPDTNLYSSWRRGLLLLLKLLSSPDGLKRQPSAPEEVILKIENNEHHGVVDGSTGDAVGLGTGLAEMPPLSLPSSSLMRQHSALCTPRANSNQQISSPSKRLLRGLSIGTSRACGSGVVDADQLAAAAEYARRALILQSASSSSITSGSLMIKNNDKDGDNCTKSIARRNTSDNHNYSSAAPMRINIDVRAGVGVGGMSRHFTLKGEEEEEEGVCPLSVRRSQTVPNMLNTADGSVTTADSVARFLSRPSNETIDSITSGLFNTTNNDLGDNNSGLTIACPRQSGEHSSPPSQLLEPAYSFGVWAPGSNVLPPPTPLSPTANCTATTAITDSSRLMMIPNNNNNNNNNNGRTAAPSSPVHVLPPSPWRRPPHRQTSSQNSFLHLHAIEFGNGPGSLEGSPTKSGMYHCQQQMQRRTESTPNVFSPPSISGNSNNTLVNNGVLLQMDSIASIISCSSGSPHQHPTYFSQHRHQQGGVGNHPSMGAMVYDDDDQMMMMTSSSEPGFNVTTAPPSPGQMAREWRHHQRALVAPTFAGNGNIVGSRNGGGGGSGGGNRAFPPAAMHGMLPILAGQNSSFSQQQQLQQEHPLLAARNNNNNSDATRDGGSSSTTDTSFTATTTTSGWPSPARTPISVVQGWALSASIESIPWNQLQLGRLLGEGAEGPVHAAWYKETPVAVKRIASLVEVEMNLHAGHHDNVVGLRGVSQKGNAIHIVMELCPRGTLDLLLHGSSPGEGGGGGGGGQIDPSKLLPIVRSIARGMFHLHTKKPAILHRDLKPGNLFIGHGFIVKIGDFGMARYIDNPSSMVVAVLGNGGGSGGEANMELHAHGNNMDGLENLMIASSSSSASPLTLGVIGTAAYCAPEIILGGGEDASGGSTPTAATASDHHHQTHSQNNSMSDYRGGNQPLTSTATTPPVVGKGMKKSISMLNLQSRPYDPERILKADVYSFGVTLWELLSRRRPHADMTHFQIQTQWMLDPDLMKLPPVPLPASSSSSGNNNICGGGGGGSEARVTAGQAHVMAVLAELVEICTAFDPDDRPSFREILQELRRAANEMGAGGSPVKA